MICSFPRSSATTYTLGPDQRVADAPVELYRRKIPLILQTGGVAEELVIDATTSRLEGQFLSYIFDAHGVDGTSLTGTGTVIVDLPAPRRIRRIKVATVALGTPAAAIGLHRVDVDKVTEEATVELASNAIGNLDFADAHFAIRLAGSKPVQPAQVEILEVASFAASPRLGVVLAGAPADEEPQFFWQGKRRDRSRWPAGGWAGERRRRPGRSTGSPRQPAPGEPARADPADSCTAGRALLIESNAPCQFQLTNLGITYRVMTQSWLDAPAYQRDEKQVLRFAGGRLDTQTLSVAVPAAAVVHAAMLRLVESQATARPSTAGAGTAGLGISFRH